MADIKFKLEVEQGNFGQAIDRAIGDINRLGREMGATQSEIKKAYSDLGKQSFAIGGNDAVVYFQNQVKEAAKVVADLEAEMQKVGTEEGFDKGSKEAKELEGNLAVAKKELESLKAAYDGAEGEQLAQASQNAKGLGDAMNSLPGPIGGAVSGLKKLLTAAKAFIATPLGAVIAALAAALGVLKSYFSGSADGQAKMAKSSAYLGSILSSLKDVAIAIGRALSNAFDNPIESIKNLWKAIQKNLMTRLEGVVQQFSALGKMIKSLFSADWNGLKEGAKEYADSMAKIGTGKSLEDLKNGINSAKDSMTAFAKKAKETADAMAVLATREYNLRQQRSKWQIKEAGLEEEIAKARLAAYDEEATASERADALAKAQELITQKYQQQIAFAQEEYEITKKRNSLHESTIEDLEKEDELNANITRLQAQMTSELAGIERRRATAARSAKAEEYRMAQEQLSLEIQVGEKRLELQDESLEKTMEQIRLTKQKQQIELQNQEHEWREKQKGELTDAQEAYIKSMSGLIEEAAVVAGEQAIFEKYADAAQKAMKQNAQSESEIALLRSKGKDREAAEAERQRNEQALAYMQDVEGGLTPEFKAWIDSLGDMTLKTLESELKKAEESLTALKAKNASTEEIMAAEARIAALNKEVKEAQTDIQRGPKLAAYKNLNKVLGDAASGFEALGQTGNEAFDSLMKNVSTVLTSVQNVVGSIQAYVKASIEAEKNAADEGAQAVKSVEKASVILAIIGAVLAIAMKLKGLFEDTGDLTGELTKQVADLRTELAKVRREMALDVSANSTIFGENAAENLRQYAQATTDYAEQYRKSVDSMARSGLRASLMIDREGHEIWSKEKADELAGQFIDAKGLGKSMGNSLNEAINTMLDTTEIQTRKSGWLGMRKAKYDTLRNILDDVDIIGDSDEETIENLKALIATQKNLPPETKRTIEEMIADWETYNDAIEGTKGVLAGFFNDMTNSFAESIKTGFTDGAKAGRQNFKEQVNGMVSDFYLQMRIGERTAQMEKDYTERMTKASGNTKEQQNIALAYANELSKMYDEELAAYEALQTDLENRGYGLKDALDGTLSGAIKGASQESIDLLSGYCNAVRIQQVDGINIMREQLISLSGIEGNTRSIDNHFASFRREFANSLTQDASRASGVVLN